MASHLLRTSMYKKVKVRSFLYSMFNDMAAYLKQCESSQRQQYFLTTVNTELSNVSVFPNRAKKTGIGLCSLPAVDAFHYLVILFSSTTFQIDKDSLTVAHFLCKLISHHGCFKIQIKNQRHKFINSVLKSCMY